MKENLKMQPVAKKLAGQNRRSNMAMGSIKYCVKISKNVKEAFVINKLNNDNLWKEAIIK